MHGHWLSWWNCCNWPRRNCCNWPRRNCCNRSRIWRNRCDWPRIKRNCPRRRDGSNRSRIRGRGCGDAITGDLDVTRGSNSHTCGKLKMVKKGSRSAYPWNTNARRMHSTVSTVSSHTLYSMKQRTRHYSLRERILRNIGANRKEQHLPRKQSAVSGIDHLDQSLLVLLHRRRVSLKNDEGEVGVANARSYL